MPSFRDSKYFFFQMKRLLESLKFVSLEINSIEWNSQLREIYRILESSRAPPLPSLPLFDQFFAPFSFFFSFPLYFLTCLIFPHRSHLFFLACVVTFLSLLPFPVLPLVSWFSLNFFIPCSSLFLVRFPFPRSSPCLVSFSVYHFPSR